MEQIISIAHTVGKGYKSFWNCKKRYRIIKGGRASKKSCTISLYYIYMLMKWPLANLVVIRRYFNTHRDSTFAQLKWAINKLGVKSLWKCTMNPLEMVYLPTGQKILFRGFDDPQSITSITVDIGYLCWCWIRSFLVQHVNQNHFNCWNVSLR